ncbi:cyclophilin-like fold protein [Methanococcus sp. CF]
MKVSPKYNGIKRMLLFSGVLLLAVLITGCVEQNNLDQNINNQSEDEQIELNNSKAGDSKMRISIESNGESIVFELNNGQAAKELYEQLPLTVEVKNYSTNEKIFYPPNKLNTSNTPLTNAKTGTLAYYAPWGDVVIFYGNFGSAGGLYELGNVVSGSEHIQNMSGTITINKM